MLILESLAQAGSILILTKDEFKGKMAYIGGIDKAKFRQKVTPGDVMKLEFEITKFRGKVGIASATALVDGKKKLLQQSSHLLLMKLLTKRNNEIKRPNGSFFYFYFEQF